MGRFFPAIWNALQSSAFIPARMRVRLLRLYGMQCGDDAVVYESTFFGSPKVSLGKGVFVSVRCLFDGSDRISIGANTYLAMGVSILTSSHQIGDCFKRAGPLKTAPVDIGNGCWIGANVTIQPDVKISDGCVVAAGSVVTSSTRPNGLYAGSPARRIRDLD